MSPDGRSAAPSIADLSARAQRWVARWVGFWDEREPPTALALIRILIGSTVIVDLVLLAWHGATPWLWAPREAGGLPSFDPSDPPLFYRSFPPTAASATLLWGGLLASAIGVAVGCFTRVASLAHVWLSVQTVLINAEGDRAIDRLIRIVLLILILSPAGKVWSVDAKRATGSFRGDPSPAPAWARRLIFAQLVLTYFAAGLAKGGTHWYPWGGYNALYLTLSDPILSSVEPSWLASRASHLATQAATAVTHLWEVGAPILLLAAHYRRTADRSGRLRRFFNRAPVREVYVAIGITFHLTLAATMRLGIFPFAMLACFPAFFRAEEVERAVRWRFGRKRIASGR